MFCPCAREYLMVDGVQTEKPRLVRSRNQHLPTPSSRAPLPTQIRVQAARSESHMEDGQAQEGTFGPGKSPPIVITPIPEEPESAHIAGKNHI
ncbi:hypothetical protein BDV18DRAFT_161437 [Aspergillus unguis]